MGIKSLFVAALATVAIATPIPDPLNVIRQSGPAAGQVRTWQSLSFVRLRIDFLNTKKLGKSCSKTNHVFDTIGHHQVQSPRPNRPGLRRRPIAADADTRQHAQRRRSQGHVFRHGHVVRYEVPSPHIQLKPPRCSHSQTDQ
jgi:hypothetical protein